jgi:IclR family acetate operon transcriptional repressor
MPATVAKAIDVLGAIASEHEGMTVSQIATRLGMTHASASRMLKTLRDEGVIRRDDASGRVYPGLKLWSLGAPAVKQLTFRRVALPVLAAALGHLKRSANLGVAMADSVLYLETLDLVGNFVTSVPAGLEMPYHATTMGKAILAFQSPDFVERIIKRGLQSYTQQTITNGDDLKRELTGIRDYGFALNRGEYRDTGLAVAVPLLSMTGLPVAAISVPASADEVDPESDLVKELVQLGRSISRQLGYGEVLNDTSV